MVGSSRSLAAGQPNPDVTQQLTLVFMEPKRDSRDDRRNIHGHEDGKKLAGAQLQWQQRDREDYE
jgi:hypothetical protein